MIRAPNECPECVSMRIKMASMGARLDRMRHLYTEARQVAIDMVRWIDEGYDEPLLGSDGYYAISQARRWVHGREERTEAE